LYFMQEALHQLLAADRGELLFRSGVMPMVMAVAVVIAEQALFPHHAITGRA